VLIKKRKKAERKVPLFPVPLHRGNSSATLSRPCWTAGFARPALECVGFCAPEKKKKMLFA
jgi:hypothetical protein